VAQYVATATVIEDTLCLAARLATASASPIMLYIAKL
jgi:hypothetical protein